MKKILLSCVLVFSLFTTLSAQDLMTAIESKNYEQVERLLQTGSKVNKPNREGQYPLWHAVWNNDGEMVRLLIRYGADVNQKFKAKKAGISCLHIASQEGFLNIVQILVENGAGVDEKGAGNQTALRVAARNGRTDIVKYLMEKGAEIDTRGDDQATPLEAAAGKGHMDIVEMLLAAGANINHQDKDRDTPLGEAAYNGQEAMVKYLLEKGADASLKNKEGYTAADRARLAGQNKIADLLRALGK